MVPTDGEWLPSHMDACNIIQVLLTRCIEENYKGNAKEKVRGTKGKEVKVYRWKEK